MTKLEELIENNIIECVSSVVQLSEKVRKSVRCLFITNTLQAISDGIILNEIEVYGYKMAVIYGEKGTTSLRGLDGLPCVTSADLFNYEDEIDFNLFGNMPSLMDMYIAECVNIKNLNGLGKSTSIESLLIFNCYKLKDISDIGNMSNLSIFGLHMCNEVNRIRYLAECEMLDTLYITACNNIYDFDSISGCHDLLTLEISQCNIYNLDMLSNLSKLERLNVSKNSKLVNIEGISDLKCIEKLELHDCGNLADVSALAKLIGLKELSLEGCPDIKSIDALEYVNGLEELNLNRCFKIDNLEAIKNCTKLKKLHLDGLEYVTSLDFIDTLTELTILSIKRCSGIKHIDFKNRLSKLGLIDFEKCVLLRDVVGLDGCTRLETINLSMCSLLSRIELSKDLVNVRELYLENCKKLENIDFVAHMPALNKLVLRGCKRISDLSPLAKTTMLTELNLDMHKNASEIFAAGFTAMNGTDVYWKDNNIEDISVIGGLIELRILNLSNCKNISDIDVIRNLTKLEKLCLSGCDGISDISPLADLTNLVEINLNYCGDIKNIEALSKINRLKDIGLNECSIKTIPKALNDLGLIYNIDYESDEGISIIDTKIKQIPESLFRSERRLIDEYFEEEQMPLNEVKVVLLGDGDVGKSYIIDRIRNDGNKLDKSYVTSATEGIHISEYKTGFDDEEVKIKFWDFGGQAIDNAIHRCFLTERTLYVVVLNARTDLMNERICYWLNCIESLARNCSIIVVINKMDENRNACLNEVNLKSEYHSWNTDTLKISALKDSKEDFDKLIKTIVSEVKKMDNYGMQLPSKWINVKNEIDNMKLSGNSIMDSDSYLTICNQNGIDKDIAKWLLEWFYDLGICFNCGCANLYDYDRDEAKESYLELSEEDRRAVYTVLEPTWIINAIYKVLHRGKSFKDKDDTDTNGVVTRKEFRAWIDRELYSINQCNYILEIMKKFNIAYSTNGSNDEIFIPALCNRMITQETLDKLEAKDLVNFKIKYQFLPDNVMHRFMIDIYKICKNDDSYGDIHILNPDMWKDGIKYDVIVDKDSFSSDEKMVMHVVVKAFANTIDIYIMGQMHKNHIAEQVKYIRNKFYYINDEICNNQRINEFIVYNEDGMSEEYDYEYVCEAREHSSLDGLYSRVFERDIKFSEILKYIEMEKDMEDNTKKFEQHTTIYNNYGASFQNCGIEGNVDASHQGATVYGNDNVVNFSQNNGESAENKKDEILDMLIKIYENLEQASDKEIDANDKDDMEYDMKGFIRELKEGIPKERMLKRIKDKMTDWADKGSEFVNNNTPLIKACAMKLLQLSDMIK